MKKFLQFLIWLIVVLYIMFIFSNSLMDGETSGKLSYTLAKSVLKFFQRYEISMSVNLFHSLLRKFAHFIEFYVLGFIVSVAIITCPLFKSKIINFMLFLFTIPVTDEAIQHFVPDRVSTYKDMIIDAAGMIFGGLTIYILFLIIKDLSSSFKKVANS